MTPSRIRTTAARAVAARSGGAAAGSRKARGFYAKNGWQELASVDFGTGYPPYVVLGKRLTGPR